MDNNSILIKVCDYANNTITNRDAIELKDIMNTYLLIDKDFVLSFENIGSVSSSFLNSSIGFLIDKYGYEKVKKHLKITRFTPTIGLIIKNYMKSNECKKIEEFN